MADEKATTPAPEGPPKFNIKDFEPHVQEEIRVLQNIENLLKKVKGLEGDEAFAYVESRQYVAQRASFLAQSEIARLRAEQAKKAPKAETETPKAPPKLEVVASDPAPTAKDSN